MSTAATELSVGSPIPLRLQLFNESETSFVTAEVCTSNGQILGTFSLAHKVGGLYTYQSQTLLYPDVAEVYAVYRVYTDSSLTVRDKKHLVDMDVYQKAISGGAQNVDVSELKTLIEQVLSTLKSADAESITAYISEAESVAGIALDRETLSVSIADTERLDVLVGDEAMQIGIIDTEQIQGIVTDE